MELTSVDGQTRFTLTIMGYQFPDAAGVGDDPHDSNWLMVKCHFDTPTFRWTSIEPCLLSWESEALCGWLRRVADQSPALNPAVDFDRSADPDVMVFVEPNLAFSVIAYPTAESAVVRVHVSFVSLEVEGLGAWQDGLYGSHVDVEVSRDAILKAAEALRLAMLEHPIR